MELKYQKRTKKQNKLKELIIFMKPIQLQEIKRKSL